MGVVFFKRRASLLFLKWICVEFGVGKEIRCACFSRSNYAWVKVYGYWTVIFEVRVRTSYVLCVDYALVCSYTRLLASWLFLLSFFVCFLVVVIVFFLSVF